MGKAAQEQAKLVFWLVLVEYGSSQSEEALWGQEEEVMQHFERKEEGKNKENRFIRLYMSTWSLVVKYTRPVAFSAYPPSPQRLLGQL